MAINQTFSDMVCETLRHLGCQSVDEKVSEDAVIVAFERDGMPGHVTASAREIRMNSGREALIGLVQARVDSAFRASRAA